ncbi:MAG: helix-turn-helix domain-containing protein [bacterium]|nr:helix-turn-helix domain-containing protein [bacterium]
MEIIVFEKESFHKMLEELAIRNFQTAKKFFEKEEWIGAEEAKKILGVKSKGKLQQMRDNFQIEFSQFGKIIRYSRTSIYKFLEKNRVSIEGYM